MKKIFCMIFAILFAVGSICSSVMADGGTPEPTQQVDSTDAPDAANTPEATDVPESTDIPEATNVPDATDVPNATDVPEAAETPEETTPEPGDTIGDVTGGEYTTMKEGDWRVVMGADLTNEERTQVYSIFGLDSDFDSSKLLTVTNSEERFYFEGKIPLSEIGSKSISCIYIKALKKGSGLDIKTYNIDYCTKEMYTNVLVTVGITDASIVVAAPRAVSGTAALTGVYKAYESMTGNIINEYAKLAGIDELITTGELARMIGSEEATEIINEIKKILDVTKDLPDDQVREKIREIAAEYDVTLTDNQVEQILILSRTLEGLDVEQLRARALGLINAANGWQKFTDTVSGIIEDIGQFFKDIAQFLSDLFDKWFAR